MTITFKYLLVPNLASLQLQSVERHITLTAQGVQLLPPQQLTNFDGSEEVFAIFEFSNGYVNTKSLDGIKFALRPGAFAALDDIMKTTKGNASISFDPNNF